jgi:hypothetical protein
MLGLAAVMLFFAAMGHKYYHVNGSIHFSPPGPSEVELPAVACMWANSYGLALPTAVAAPDEDSRTAYVVCQIPEDGVGIPFHVSEYSNSGHGLLIGAFLRSLTSSHVACSDPGAIAVLVSDPYRQLSAACENGQLPPKSETALMAPFDDDEGRPTSTMRIDIYRAE